MKKNRYHTIITADLLTAVIKTPESERAEWLLQFALDLSDDNPKTAKTEYGREVIEYTKKRSDRKVEAGKKGAKKRWQKEPENSNLDSSAIANQCDTISISEGESECEGESKQSKPKPITGKRFKEPTVEEVKAHCQMRGNSIDPEAFVAHYDSNGWRVGKNKMKSWKSAIITWEKNPSNRNGNGKAKTTKERIIDGFREKGGSHGLLDFTTDSKKPVGTEDAETRLLPSS